MIVLIFLLEVAVGITAFMYRDKVLLIALSSSISFYVLNTCIYSNLVLSWYHFSENKQNYPPLVMRNSSSDYLFCDFTCKDLSIVQPFSSSIC